MTVAKHLMLSLFISKILSNLIVSRILSFLLFRYYFNGRTVTSDDFLNIDIYNELIAQTELMKGIVTYCELDSKPIWLSKCNIYIAEREIIKLVNSR